MIMLYNIIIKLQIKQCLILIFIMKYKRLPFDVYFTICSQNYNGKKCSEPIAQYKSIPYNYKGEDYDANYQVRFDEKRQCIQVIFQATTEMSD